ncbi:MAG: proline racemase family protein [Thermodesulfobacteriota bacterium]
MRLKHIIHVVDSHTAGEPTRIVISGLPFLPGHSIAEKRDYFKAQYDHLRKALLWEPRGHRDMFGAVLTPPTNPKAQVGVFFIESEGYLDMCGHGSMGVIAVCLELGIIPRKRPKLGWNLDTPVGLVPFKPEFKGGALEAVSVQNVPSFLFKSDLFLSLPKRGEIKADIAFGGNFFLLVDASQLGISLDLKNARTLIEMGMTLRDIANQKFKVHHPHFAAEKSIHLVEIYQSLKNQKADAKNVVIFGKGQLDRSPCGTGMSAKMALLHAKKLLNLNMSYVQESILGTFFSGRLLSETKVGKYQAVVPEITGSAWITGFNQLIIDSDDPFANGFFLS